MQYLGGKAKVAKYLVPIINSYRKPGQLYIEPFIGGGNIFVHMDAPKLGLDLHPQLIALYKAIKTGWEPPKIVSEEDYKRAKAGEFDDALRGFIGFACSFSGIYFSGYARSGDRNYALNSYNWFTKNRESLSLGDYELFDFMNLTEWGGALIYCDPPYRGTAGYSTGAFNHEQFWDTVRVLSQDNTILVSEYMAPNDFEVIYELERRLEMQSKDKTPRIERLFKFKG